MKRILCQLLLLVLSLHMYAVDEPQFFYHTVQVGKTITVSSNTYSYLTSYENRCGNYSQYDPSIISVSRNNSTFTIKGLRKGWTTVIMLPQTVYASAVPYFHVIHVVDVSEISILPSITVLVGEHFTYEPKIVDVEAKSTFTWASNNADVATISNSGEITAVSPGKAIITCKAENGVTAQSIVYVSPILAQEIILDKQNIELSIGESTLVQSSVFPQNVNSSSVTWFSGNDNVAQVDSDGNVLAVTPGYCSIYAIARDGSGKFGKCLIHVKGEGSVKGDVNGDSEVTAQDASVILQYVAKKINW